MRNIIKITLLFILAIGIYSCKKAWDKDIDPQYLQNGSLYDFLKKDPEVSQFVSLAQKTGLDSVLRKSGPFTVLAVKNGGFAGVDTTNLATVKKLIGIHILPSAAYRENMNNLRIPSVSGKYVRFATASAQVTANNVAVSGDGDRVSNGVIYKLATAITPLPNLYDIIANNADYSLYNTYIKNSFLQTFDPVNNIIVRYDSIGKPVYKQPFKYINTSQFINYSKIDSEKVEQTVFIPTNAVVTKILGLMLAARGGNQSLVIPAITQNHGEMNVGGNYFPTNVLYPGDSTVAQNYLFRNTIINGIISNLASGTNTFTSKDGNVYQVNPSQVSSGGLASNGRYFVLNDVTLPGSSYRKTFMFDPRIDLTPAILAASVSVGAKTTNTTGNSGTAIDRYNQFDFGNTNGKIIFTFPFVTAGKYRPILRYTALASSPYINVSYNGTPLLQNLDTSTFFITAISVDIQMPVISIAADGQAPFAFQCAAPGSQNGSGQLYKFNLNTIRLVPVD